jgi:hypothetical protein
MCVVERKWRRPACTHGRAVTATEETGLSDVDGGRGDRRSREWRGLRQFYDKKRNVTWWATIYRFETISSGSGL